MSTPSDRRPNSLTSADPAEIDLGLVTIDLRAELSAVELEQFLANAAAAGRTPTEHFKAISIGSSQSSRAA